MVRKRNRLSDYDYSSNGAYFVTICVEKRHEILSSVGDDVLGVPYIELKNYGKICEYILEKMNNLYSDINVVNYVIMPNHIHMIITVEGAPRTSPPTTAKIPLFISTFKRFVGKKIGFQIFQRSYYDHIIRNKYDFNEKWNYIEKNPFNWKDDEFYIKV